MSIAEELSNACKPCATAVPSANRKLPAPRRGCSTASRRLTPAARSCISSNARAAIASSAASAGRPGQPHGSAIVGVACDLLPDAAVLRRRIAHLPAVAVSAAGTLNSMRTLSANFGGAQYSARCCCCGCVICSFIHRSRNCTPIRSGTGKRPRFPDPKRHGQRRSVPVSTVAVRTAQLRPAQAGKRDHRRHRPCCARPCPMAGIAHLRELLPRRQALPVAVPDRTMAGISGRESTP